MEGMNGLDEYAAQVEATNERGAQLREAEATAKMLCGWLAGAMLSGTTGHTARSFTATQIADAFEAQAQRLRRVVERDKQAARAKVMNGGDE